MANGIGYFILVETQPNILNKTKKYFSVGRNTLEAAALPREKSSISNSPNGFAGGFLEADSLALTTSGAVCGLKLGRGRFAARWRSGSPSKAPSWARFTLGTPGEGHAVIGSL